MRARNYRLCSTLQGMATILGSVVGQREVIQKTGFEEMKM